MNIAKQCIRKYARCLQKKGYPVKLVKIKLCTMSATHKLINKPDMINYEPELSNCACFSKYGMTFLIHFNGTVLITGIKDLGKLIEAALLLDDE
jgi:hypothetical protein